MPDQFLFLDANILLHYDFFDEIDWIKVAGTASVELVLPYTIISILDEKKYLSSDPAVKERARKVIAKLRELDRKDSSLVRNGVTLRLLPQEREMDYSQWGLNKESEDDRFIADILFFGQQHPCEKIAVVTGDFGLELKFNRHNIPLLPLAEDYLLPDRSDAQTKRIKELEATVLKWTAPH